MLTQLSLDPNCVERLNTTILKDGHVIKVKNLHSLLNSQVGLQNLHTVEENQDDEDI